MDGIMLLKEAFSLFLQEVRLSVGSSRPSYQIYASTLKSCAAISNIKLGKALHSHVVKAGHQSCQFVCKALLNMYAKSKAFDDCHNIFSQISCSHGGGGGGDAVTWNIVLSGFAGSSGTHDAEVMSLFHSMHIGEDNPRPNSVTMAIILPVCTRLRALGAGRSVHSYAVKFGLESDIIVGNSLISMYAKCGHVSDDAYAMFDKMPERDVVSWNAMIAGFVENKFINEAFELFCWMLKGPTAPNYATIANILPVCSLLEDAAYRFGTEIHGYVLRRAEIVADVSVVNALVSFYLRIGQMREAEALFRRMAFRDLVSWNSLIAGYTSNGEWWKAVELFREFISVEVFRPDCITILSILPACAHHLQVGKQIHGYIIRHPALCEDTAVGNALISFYAKCCHTEAAFRTFSLIYKRDLISWNSMLNAFAESRLETHFVDHLQGMVMEGIIPDSVTVLTVLQFCATVSRGANVKEAHCFLIKSGLLLGHGGEPILGNALIDAYAKCENMDYALRFFEILSGKRRNVVTCNSIISGYVKCGLHDNALMIFERMSVRDLTTWNLMVRVYAENDCPTQALSLFHELQKNNGMKPDALTVMSLLPVCAQMASVQLLRQCHGYVVRSCFSDDDVCLNGALLDLYSKCGGVTAAYKLFKSTPKKDLVMFTSMIGGFAMHGMGEEALGVFYHMLELGLKPDHVIITAVLSACSHTGLVDKGLEIFESTEKVYGIKPTMEQYACVVDLLARGGRISDAYSFVDKIMPIEANASIWGTLLGACRNHQMVEMGRQVADRLFEIESNNIGNYVVMSNLYAANGRWDGVLEIRKLMKMRDLKKPAGCSWIEVEGSKNVFIAADSSHPQRSSIYSILSTLDQQIKERFQFTVGRL